MTKVRMTKQTALRVFREQWNIAVNDQPRLATDTVAKCESWNAYTDSLCKDGYITLRQYESWVNPF